MIGGPSLLSGIRIVSSPLATTRKVWFTVERHGMLKRRRNWKSVRHETQNPAAYKDVSGTIYMHPELYAKLKAETL